MLRVQRPSNRRVSSAVSRLKCLRESTFQTRKTDWEGPQPFHSSSLFLHEFERDSFGRTLLALTMGTSQYDDHTKSGRLLHTIFESQVSSSPDRDAIQTYTLGSSRAITYYELNSEANKIARLLQSTKSPQVNTIAICMDKEPTLVAVVLAVLKLGCAWSPVDPKTPAKRKNKILQELGKCHLLVTPGYAVDFQQCPPSTSVFVWDDSSSTAVSVQSSDNIRGIKCSPESPCHILWTSGSTGVPKGRLELPKSLLFTSLLIQISIRRSNSSSIRCK
jgi:long-subunit acyl-CoA synthetase (AMP-forming)